MCSKRRMKEYTKDYWDNIKKVDEFLKNADAIVVGVGAGMSTSAGMTYSGERFEKYFSDFKEKYGITDMYSGGFYPFENLREYWAWWSRHIYYNRYNEEIGKPYKDLFEILKDKNYFIITTNVDHQLQKANFNKNRLYYMQGDYGLIQCSIPCHHKTYDNKELIKKMLDSQENMKIPSELIPYCPKCGSPMTTNLRSDEKFVEDSGLHEAQSRYMKFIEENKNKKVVFFELGVGKNTPGIIKYPFMKMTYQNKNAHYITLNVEKEYLPEEIKSQTITVLGDIGETLENILKLD